MWRNASCPSRQEPYAELQEVSFLSVSMQLRPRKPRQRGRPSVRTEALPEPCLTAGARSPIATTVTPVRILLPRGHMAKPEKGRP